MFFWLKRLIRNTTKPIPQNTAETWNRRLKIAYNLLAWNALGIVAIACYQGKLDWAEYYGLTEKETVQQTPGEKWFKYFNPKNATVYRISGINVTKIAEYSNGERIDKESTDENEMNINSKQ